MMAFTLTDRQLELVNCPVERRIFLEGPAGAGKTTAGVGRLLHLLRSGVAGCSILVFVPQRTLAAPYHEVLRRPTVGAGEQVTISTVGGLAQRMVDLFWPLVAQDADFAHPDLPPVFLTLETAQYYMARLVRPLLEEGYFETVTIDRNRLYSQILDNLNKAAVVGFPYTEIGARLKSAWGGEQSQQRVYDEVQECATLFRRHCLAHNLLDFSLQIELFLKRLWSLSLCRDYLLETYTHILVDNVEEDTPVAHDVLADWLSQCRSALLIYDRDAGYRRFLGADPESGYELRASCDHRVTFPTSRVTSDAVADFGRQLGRSVNRLGPAPGGDVRAALVYAYHRYYPQLLDWVADETAALVAQGTAPGEIVVLSPFLPDVLRFSLMHRLEQRGVPARSHRPSRALRDEPATRCLLTLAAIAHPCWGIHPSRFDLAYAMVQAIDGMDLVRAQILAEIVYRVRDDTLVLGSFDQINLEMQERLTFTLGERYERLRAWLEAYAADPLPELDHFLSHLFGELLSQPGYLFHRDYDAARVTADLIESVQKFRWAVGEISLDEEKSLGQEYVEMVRDGVVAAQYVRGWQLQAEDAVLLAPAYTFLMRNRPVDVQFWLDIGGRGWWERLNQPLTHPYVLSRRWSGEGVWTEADEFAAEQEALYRLTQGLIRRCRRFVYLGFSELNEQGIEQKGRLLHAIQRVLRDCEKEE
ncbi:MAG: hypothetical protein JW900_10135 [Anaerolineae bacterium]|nr:hypothetical protein [Anaerolineae bacterium]